jgi:hypothetical protein
MHADLMQKTLTGAAGLVSQCHGREGSKIRFERQKTGVAASLFENCRNSNFHAHPGVPESGYSQSSPEWGIVRHVLAEKRGHDLDNFFRKPQMIGNHGNYVSPICAGGDQRSTHVEKRLRDFVG